MATSGISTYRKTLFDVSEGLDKQDLRHLRYLCKDELTKTQDERIEDGLGLFEILEEKGIISDGDVSFLIDRMGDLRRRDLQTLLQQIIAPETVSPLGAPQGLPLGTSASDSARVVAVGASNPPSPRHLKSFSQLLPNKGLKTPADFSPHMPKQNQAGAGSINPSIGHTLQRSDPEVKKLHEGPTMKTVPKKTEVPILDLPNIMTPCQSETVQHNSGTVGSIGKQDRIPRTQASGMEWMQSLGMKPEGTQAPEREPSGQGLTLSSSKSLHLGQDDSDVMETDAPQSLQDGNDEPPLSPTQGENPTSLPLQDVASLQSEAAPVQDVEKSASPGIQDAKMDSDISESVGCHGILMEEAAGDYEIGEQIQLRDYQIELAHYPLATGGNYIICAPTGSGKTLTAASICKENYMKFKATAPPGKHFKALFIVNMRHLTQQQKKAFQDYFTDILAVRTIGEQETFEYALMKDEPLPIVLMLTAQIVVNALKQQTVSLQDVNMLIFDECHHTTLSHPYNVIMKRYLKQKFADEQAGILPQVIGLSASLGVGRGQSALEHVLKLCANMDARDVLRVRRHKEQLDQYVKTPEQDAIIPVLSRVSARQSFGGLVEQLMSKIEGQLAKKPRFHHGSQPYENEVVQCQEVAKHEDIITYMYLNAYNRALMLYEDLPTPDCLQTLEAFHAGRSLGEDQEDTSRESHCRELFQSNLEEMKSMADKEGGSYNLKLKELVKLLADQFTQNPNSKGIILTRMKVATVALCEFIRSSEKLRQCSVRPERLVGQGSLDDQCMTESEQKMILESFRQEDGCNVLVATDIAQEGLDMPACNFVIRYNFVSNEIGTVQSKGRARAEGSQCFLIVERGSLNEERELENRGKVKRMEEALNQLENTREADRLACIRAKQRLIVKDILEKERRRQEKIAEVKGKDLGLLCVECKTFICKVADLRRKGAGGAITCVDQAFPDKVFEIPLAYSVRYRDTQSMCNVMCGKNRTGECKTQLGTKEDFFLDEISEGYSLRAKSFRYQGTEKKLKKWNEVIPEDEFS